MRTLVYQCALTCLVLLSVRAGAVDRMIEGFPDLPSDARGVAERYMGCQHFWGEVDGTGGERDREVAAQLKMLKCDRVEQDLERVKNKYLNRPDVLRILEEASFTALPMTAVGRSQKATSTIGGIRIGATKGELAHLGAPTVRRTSDALDPEWRFKNGLVASFWDNGDAIAGIASRARSVCTDTGICPGMSAARLNDLLGPDLAGQYPLDGEHQYPATYDTCWLEVAVSNGLVGSIALTCQP